VSPVPDNAVQHFANSAAHNVSRRNDARAFPCGETARPTIIQQPVGRRRRGPVTHIEGFGWIVVRNSSKSRLAWLAVAMIALWSIAVGARAQITFIPPNDPVGAVATTNSNDSWSGSRGIVFQATATQTIYSIGLYQNLTGIVVNYEIDQTTSASGNIGTGKTVLRSGNGTFTTSGLQFITFNIAPLQLVAGNFYQVRFDFTGNSNQNFFYNNNNVVFSQPGFSQIDGTQGDDTANSVMPQIVLNTPLPGLPALSPAALMALALLLAGASALALRRRARSDG
jgi:hypothetical protein